MLTEDISNNINQIHNIDLRMSQEIDDVGRKFGIVDSRGYSDEDAYWELQRNSTLLKQYEHQIDSISRKYQKEYKTAIKQLPVALIDGKPATTSSVVKLFKQNDWDYVDFGGKDIPEEGTPIRGYRVFTYIEGDENTLGSPVAGFGDTYSTPFRIPQYKDSVNIDDTGHGFYIFTGKGAALQYVLKLLSMDSPWDEHNTGENIHFVVHEVQGDYVSKYDRGTDAYYRNYGEKINNMKVIGDALLDISTKAPVGKNPDAYEEQITGITRQRYVEKYPLAGLAFTMMSSDPHRSPALTRSFWKNSDMPQEALDLLDLYRASVPVNSSSAISTVQRFTNTWNQFYQDHPEGHWPKKQFRGIITSILKNAGVSSDSEVWIDLTNQELI